MQTKLKYSALQLHIQYYHMIIREGFRKKDGFFMVFCQTPPLDPPLRCGLFTDKKNYTHFFWEIESMIAKTNFTLGPIEKSIFFVQL